MRDNSPFKASKQSTDYVNNKTQYQLEKLITEQRHLETYDFSFGIKKDPSLAVQKLLSVDNDVSNKLNELALHPEPLQLMADAFQKALEENKKIYFYGCGATGRLAIQLESAIWRPFWKKVESKFPEFKGMSERVIGAITGGDRALISSLEGFEDLQLIGKLQLQENAIKKGDVVVAITEGGETSSVIGTILTAATLFSPSSPDQLFFVYNNPDWALEKFDRSRIVLENPFITKIPLVTGPQAITGSTRMQATTSEFYAVAMAMEQAILQYLSGKLTGAQLLSLGFTGKRTLSDRLRDFKPIQEDIYKQNEQIAKLSLMESAAYKNKNHAYYMAKNALISVFTDATERSPTFRLSPMDPIDSKERKSLIQVWTAASTAQLAWQQLLNRPFKGLHIPLYQKSFEQDPPGIELDVALQSLKHAGNDQQNYYDFAFSKQNTDARGPVVDDLAVFILLSENKEIFEKELLYFNSHGAKVAIISTCWSGNCPPVDHSDVMINIPISAQEDPLNIRQNIAIKMILNAHSTATMAMLGKIVGNTMAYVNPGNLKLIGRATYLIQTHVNDILAMEPWKTKYQQLYSKESLSYVDANAALFNAMSYLKTANQVGSISEVALAIIRILEPLKSSQNDITWDTAKDIILSQQLQDYLVNMSPDLNRSLIKKKFRPS